MDHKLLNFKVHGDERGKLVALESGKSVPFDIKRVYYIYDTANEAHRGKHAHPNLEQVVVCLKGSCKFSLESGGGRQAYHKA